MNKLKKKIVSRLTGEVDIQLFKKGERIDNVVARMTYGNREVVIEGKDDDEFLIYFKKSKDFTYEKWGLGFWAFELVIERAKELIKDDVVWK